METITSLSGALSAVALLVFVVFYVIKHLKEWKQSKVQTAVDYAVALVEEGVAFSEDRNRLTKRECAVNAGKALKKESVEILKDPIQVEKYMQNLLQPIRDVAHNTAKTHILQAAEEIADEGLRAGVTKVLNQNSVDDAIHFIIAGRKVGLMDPLKTYFYKRT